MKISEKKGRKIRIKTQDIKNRKKLEIKKVSTIDPPQKKGKRIVIWTWCFKEIKRNK